MSNEEKKNQVQELEDGVNEEDFNFRDLRILIDMYMKDVVEFNATDLADTIEISKHHPNYLKILNFLKLNNIIELKEVIGATKIYKLHRKKLKDLIDEQNIVQYVMDYLNKAGHIATW